MPADAGCPRMMIMLGVRGHDDQRRPAHGSLHFQRHAPEAPTAVRATTIQWDELPTLPTAYWPALT
jgi:hypothetical protein